MSLLSQILSPAAASSSSHIFALPPLSLSLSLSFSLSGASELLFLRDTAGPFETGCLRGF